MNDTDWIKGANMTIKVEYDAMSKEVWVWVHGTDRQVYHYENVTDFESDGDLNISFHSEGLRAIEMYIKADILERRCR